MNIIVAIKVVPDSQNIVVDPVTKTLNRSQAKSVINPPDRNALELALSIKDQVGGKVTVISMGPPWAEEQLKECIAIGADDAILLTDRFFAGADTYPTALTLARAVSKIHYDLVICGEETTDSSTAQVGPGIAEHLHINQATFIQSLKPSEKGNSVIVERFVEGGIEQILLPLPALVTASLNMNMPRVPTLEGRIRGKRAHIAKWELKDLDLPKEWVGLSGSPTKVREVKNEASEYRNTVNISGSSADEVAAKLSEVIAKVILHE